MRGASDARSYGCAVVLQGGEGSGGEAAKGNAVAVSDRDVDTSANILIERYGC
ncbi:MAG: hypothetical protein ACE5KL_04680 [Alphaproteobacteria bacterium]